MKAVEIAIPPDKSISHRAVMFASISEGVTRIKNLLIAEDIKRTINVFSAMGVSIKSLRGNNIIEVRGVGMRGLKKPRKPLYLGNSGTTMRILPGILAGQDFETVLTGDKSLSGRPMRRVTEPLISMGAKIGGRARSKGRLSISRCRSELYPPLTIRGNRCLKAINYKSRIASAQVKSCILLAGLYADGVTSVSEPEKSRDHTERMLSTFGCRVKRGRRIISIKGPVKLRSPGAIKIPGDISSAAFFIVAGCVLPGTKIVLKNVGLNPTRTGVLDILKRMGADISFSARGVYPDRSRVENAAYFEPYGDIVVRSSELRGVTISRGEVVRAIDEIPVIMVAACFAKGRTIIKGIEELKVKETDRVYSMTTNLQKIGADVKARKKNIIINGGRPLAGARVSSFGDHRTAMSMLVAGLGAKGKVIVAGLDCINKSFPNFPNLLNKLN